MPHMLQARLPSDRGKGGELRLVDAATGETVLGPLPCLGLASKSLANEKGNPRLDPTKGFGNTPTGSFDVLGTLPASEEPKLRDSFGPIPRLRIVGRSGDALVREAWAKDTLRIHGGRKADQKNRYLRPTAGCIRVFNADMQSLLDYIQKHEITYPFQLVVEASEAGAQFDAAPDAGAAEDPETERTKDSLAADPLASRRLLHCAASLGKSNPVQQLLVRQAVRAVGDIDAKDTAALDRLRNDFEKLAGEVDKAADLQSLQAAMLSFTARDHGVDQAFQAELLAKRIVPTISGVNEGHSVRPFWESLGQQLGSELAQRLAGDDADQVYAAVGAVLGWTAPEPDAQALAALLQDFPRGASALEAFWNTGRLPSAEAVEDLATQLALDAASQLHPALESAEKAFAYASTLGDIAGNFSWNGASAAQAAGSLKAGAGALSGILQMLGANKEAAFVAKASGYLQSAAQVQQCAALLMAGATGWGAALAVSGLVGGTAGLGIFGGPGGSGDAAHAMQATVLAAIEKLQQTMLREFAKVNEKLADITRMLEEVLREIRKTNLMLGRVLDKLEEVDRKLDLLLLRVDRGVLRLLEELHKAEDIRCMAEAYEEEITKSRLYACILFYARIASRQELYSSDGALTDLIPTLDAAFSGAPSVTDNLDAPQQKARDMWGSVGLLARALSMTGVSLPGRPASAPTLTAAVQNLAELYMLVGKMFGKLRDQQGLRECIREVRAVIFEHESFIRYLRGDLVDAQPRQYRWAKARAMRHVTRGNLASGRSSAPVVATLMDLMARDLTRFGAGCQTLRELAVRQVVADMSQGRAGIGEAMSEASIQNTKGSTFKVVDAADVAAHPAVRLLLTCIDPVSDAERLKIMLTNFDITDTNKTRHRLTISFDVDVYLYGKKVMPSWSVKELLLLYDDGVKWVAALANIDDGVKLLAYSDDQVGVSANVKIGDTLIDRLVAQSSTSTDDENIWTVQRQRVAGADRHVRLRFAQLLAGNEQDWGDAAKDLSALGQANDRKVLLRAVLRTAFEDAYNACDALPIAFEGGNGYRLLDPERLKAWAEAVVALAKPGAAADPANPMHAIADRYPEAIANERYEAFAKIVDGFIDTARGAGRSFGLERAKARFRALENY